MKPINRKPLFAEESSLLQLELLEAAETVLQLMLEHNMLADSKRRAFFLMMQMEGSPTPLLKAKIGESFLNDEFRKKCFALCEENVATQALSKNVLQATSDVSSVRLCLDKTPWIITVSGLQAHENWVAALGIIRHLGKIDLQDFQLKEICDLSLGRNDHGLLWKVFVWNKKARIVPDF